MSVHTRFFNAGFEHVFRQRKLQIHQCRWDVGADEPLTNVRYADRFIIYAQTGAELLLMLEALAGELALVSLNLNVASKNTTTENLESRCFMNVEGDMIWSRFCRARNNTKISAKKNNLRTEAAVALAHRIQMIYNGLDENPQKQRNAAQPTHVPKTAFPFFDA